MTKNLKLRNIPLILMTVFMISAMVYSGAIVRTSYAQDEMGAVFVDPSQTILTTAVVGTTFDVNVSIANVTNIGGIQYRLEWNTTLLNCTGLKEVFYHTLTPEASLSNIWSVRLSYNNTGGYSEYAQTWQDIALAMSDGYAPGNITMANYPPEGKLTIATYTFKVLLVPLNTATYYDCDLNLPTGGVKVGDPVADQIMTTVANGYYRIYGLPETTTTTITYGGTDYNVTTVTNASLVPSSMEFAKLNESSYKLDFNLTGTEGATAYVNVTIPKALMTIGATDHWTVDVNGTGTTPIVTSDDTLNVTYLYITTTLGTNVEIWGTIPELTLLFIPLLMAATLVAVVLRRRKPV